MTEFCARNRVPAAAFVACALFVAMDFSCYNPKIPSNGLKCAAAPAKQCPDGYTCVNGLCADDAEIGGKGGKGGSGGSGGGVGGGGGGRGGIGGGGGTCANAIVPSCQTPVGASAGCDPVCQTGCPCGQRCNVTASGTTCAAVSVATPKKLGEVCQLTADECAPGSICLPEPCGTNLARCYRLCRDSTVCAAPVVCGMRVTLPGGGTSSLKACNLGDQTPACDPFVGSGCPNDALVCYATTQATKCDCPSDVKAAEGERCTFTNDCMPKLTCLTTSGGAPSQCHRLCKTSADCAGGATCAVNGPFGFCP